MPVNHQSTQNSANKGKLSVQADRCWGVPLTMSVVALFIAIPSSGLGLIFVLIMDKFGVTRETASWPANLIVLTAHVAGFPVYALQRYLKTYHIMLLSAMLSSLAMVASAFVPDVLWLTVTFGAMYGLGVGMFCMAASIYVLLYFDKYKSIAMSILFVSCAVAGAISPYVLSFLTDAYGLQGAFLLFGGVLLNGPVILMLAENPRPWGFRRKGPHTACAPNTITTISRSQTEERDAQLNESPREQGCHMKRAALLFGMPAFYALLIPVVLGEYTFAEFLKTVVDYGIDKGIDRDAAGQLVTYIFVGQLLGRVGVPVLADVVPTSRGPLYGISFFISSACCIALPHAYTFSSAAVLSILEGIMQGFVVCVKYVLIAEYVGIAETPVFCGIAGAVLTPIAMVGPLITGYFRDTRGSYDNYYRLLAAISLVTSVVFLAFYWWNQYRKRSLKINEPEGTSSCR